MSDRGPIASQTIKQIANTVSVSGESDKDLLRLRVLLKCPFGKNPRLSAFALCKEMIFSKWGVGQFTCSKVIPVAIELK
jgi:hypothetical protein